MEGMRSPAASRPQPNAKGLRKRASPICTLSQNGYDEEKRPLPACLTAQLMRHPALPLPTPRNKNYKYSSRSMSMANMCETPIENKEEPQTELKP